MPSTAKKTASANYDFAAPKQELLGRLRLSKSQAEKAFRHVMNSLAIAIENPARPVLGHFTARVAANSNTTFGARNTAMNIRAVAMGAHLRTPPGMSAY